MGTIQEQLANVDPQKRFGEMMRELRVEYEKRGLPYRGTFELTPHCNLDCKMCYVHRSDGKYPHRVLTGDEWINIMDQAIDMGMLCAKLTGGECMLHPDFKRIYMHLKQRGVYVFLKTNGVLLDDAMLDLFLEYPPVNVQISVYGSSPEVYEKVTGHADAFEKVDEVLKRLQECHVPHGVTLTVSKYNVLDFENLYNYVACTADCNIGLDAELFEPTEGGQYSPDTFQLSPNEYFGVYQKFIELEYGHKVALQPEDAVEVASGCFQNDLAYPRTMPCTAGINGFFVTYYGMMLPCIDFQLTRADLRTLPFKTAWKIINRAAKAYRRSEECDKCAFLGYCFFCPAQYSKETNGKNGMHGGVPCDKKMHVLLPLLSRLSSKNKTEELSNENLPQAAGDSCEDGLF